MTTPTSPPRRGSGFGVALSWGLAHVVRWPKVFLVALVAIGLAWLAGRQVSAATVPAEALSRLLDRAVFTFGLPLIALLLAGEGFAFEVQSRTLVYHLVRPISRSTFFFARFLAGAVPAMLVSAAALTVLLLASGVGMTPRAWATVPATAGLGVLALSAIYYTLAALLRRGLVAGLVYTFVVETFLSSVPGTMQRLSVMYHVRSIHHALVEGVLVAAPPPPRHGLLFGGAKTVQDAPPGQAALTLLVVTVVVLAFGAWRISRRDYALKD